MIIIITGTISPNDNIKDLNLRNVEERLEQYKNALEKTIDLLPGGKIVFCDNSGYDTTALNYLIELADKNNVQLELLSFKGDTQNVVIHGKGYGEGEIVKYVLENSKLAANENYMVKITGRLVVDNIAEIVGRLKNDRVYFNIPNIHRRDIYDTRLYAMPISMFKQYFYEKYKEVDDGKGYILECVYRDIILSNQLPSRNFPLYPRIVGQSGSGGIKYEYTEWKSKIRDLLSFFNVYGKVEGY